MTKKSTGEKIFNVFNVIIMLLLSAIIVLPYLNVLAISLNDNAKTIVTGLMFIPKKFTLANFAALFSDSNILRSFSVTIMRVGFGVTLNFAVEFAAAYALSKRSLPFRRGFGFYFLIPSYISGGLIPTYVLYSSINLLNNPLVYILPFCFNYFTFILFRTYLGTIPPSLEESAKLDGAKDFRVMLSIYLPLCLPMIATFVLIQAVFHWNDWTTNLYYVTDQTWNTLQFELQRILREQQRLAQLVQHAVMSGQIPVSNVSTSAGVRNAQIIITTLPIILIYPFLQKYFIKGLMIGGVKE